MPGVAKERHVCLVRMPTPCSKIGSVLPILGLGFTILLDFLGRVHPKKPPHVFRLQVYSKTLSVYVLLPVTRDCSMKILPPKLFQVYVFC